jgi:uracil-DNA glycosylase
VTCRACELYRDATQTVFGEGPRSARLMLVGEQPGNYEDRAGRPFVGASGRLLDDALVEVGIDRAEAYVTNAVKHFKWVARGRARASVKPNLGEMRACAPWLRAELELVRPRVVVCLGATAAQALLGPAFRVTRQRGELLTDTGVAPFVLATVHPSSILRIADPEARHEQHRRFVADLRRAAEELQPTRA